MAQIMMNIPPTTPVDTLDLSDNLLTKIPDNLHHYSTLISVSLANNAITSVAKDSLTLSGAVTSIDLSNNLITTIAPKSLPGTLILMNKYH